jgi:hypothetical protein
MVGRSADAKKEKKKPPPNCKFVLYAGDPICEGTTGADLMVGSSPGNEDLKGAAGNDLYMGGGSPVDSYKDESTSSDLYGGFRKGESVTEVIDGGGGLDRVDLSSSFTPYASTDFKLYKLGFDGDGAEDDLQMSEESFSSDDDIWVYNHFGTGRIESINSTDKTVSGASILLS